MTRDDIPTPALLLDLDRFERNLRRMAAHARASGKNLRPHAKTHRCPEIARRQVSAGALGVACAKLGEAVVMARAGVRGLLITTEVVAPAAIRRLMQLVSAAPDTLVVVDNPANVADLGREAAADGVTVNVLVDVDVLEPGAPASLPRAGAGAGSARRSRNRRSASAGSRAMPATARTSWAGRRGVRPRTRRSRR
jgi:D-serine deaminase-like pyridoxal phosphate-dependent protein